MKINNMNFRKLKNDLLHVNNLRKFIGFVVFRAAIESEFKLQILDKPPKGNVLVLSPHSDDDVIGCGGTIFAHKAQQDEVIIYYLTGGGTLREKEAQKASNILGVKKLIFSNSKDNEISNSKKQIDQLVKIIVKYQPRIIYAPSSLDPNPDHFETAQVLASALHKIDFKGRIFSYEVWSPIHANRIINITDSIERKILALKEHKSQITSRSYIKAMQGLAQYRAGMFNAGEYAEAFFSCNKDLYLKLFDLMKFKNKEKLKDYFSTNSESL